MARLELTWLGQASFLVETDETRLLIDPWVSPGDGRLIEPPPLELVADGIDWVLVTHEHSDHLDVAFLRQVAERSPAARLVIPEPIVDLAEDVLPATTVRPGDSIEVAELRVDVVPAWHGILPADAYTDGEGRFVGYVLHAPDVAVYYAGDTIPNDGLFAALDGKGVDVALLPINGRDFFREQRDLVGNCDAREAVQVALRMGASTLVPYHWDGFAGNTVRPGGASDEAAAADGPLHVLVLARLVPYRLAG
jgi:L-ascorbate metabolism protein UlaG (beta-lactamase superfamily)